MSECGLSDTKQSMFDDDGPSDACDDSGDRGTGYNASHDVMVVVKEAGLHSKKDRHPS